MTGQQERLVKTVAAVRAAYHAVSDLAAGWSLADGKSRSDVHDDLTEIGLVLTHLEGLVERLKELEVNPNGSL